MKAGAGKGKGSQFERDICKSLSKWLSNGERTDLFTRNVISGGAFTTSAAKGNAQGHPGDVMASEPKAHLFLKGLFVECKFWSALQIEAALWGKGELAQVVKKTTQQARSSQRRYLLITKQNNRPVVLFTEQEVGRIITQVSPHVLHHKLWCDKTYVFLLTDFYKLDPDAFMLALADLPQVTRFGKR